MKVGRNLTMITMLILLLVTTIYAADLPGLRVDGRFLYDNNGERIVLRGANVAIVFWDRHGEINYPELAKTGANCARIFWMTGHRREPVLAASGLDSTIENCIKHKMIPMVSVWDATGDWGELQNCVDYWLRDDVSAVLKKHEEYLLLNIANEAGNRDMGSAVYRAKYSDLVQQLRDGGLHMPIVIDADHWGRNGWACSESGPYLLEQDPDHNLIFSWHLWDPQFWNTGTKENIKLIIDASIDSNICMIVGEFGPYQFGDDELEPENAINWEYMIDYCDTTEIGWLAWVWWAAWGKEEEEHDVHSMTNIETGLYGEWANAPWGETIADRITATSVRPQSILETFIKKPEHVNDVFALSQNYPNPFNPSTMIHYTLQKSGMVQLEIYNVNGKIVKSLVQENQSPGSYSVVWDGLTVSGEKATSGMYISRLLFVDQSGANVKTSKMLLIQ